MKVTPEEAHLIRYLRNHERYSIPRIAKSRKLSETTVRETLNNFARASARRTRSRDADHIAHRRNVVADIARLKVTARIHGRDVAIGKQFPTLQEIANEYERLTGHEVSIATVQRDLVSQDIKSVRRPRVVNNDPIKNKARLDFARDIRRQKITGKQVIYSDECWMNNNENTNRREWTAPGETPTVRRFQKRPDIKIMVWGAIGHNFKSKLVFIEGTVDANVYIATMGPHIKRMSRLGRIFMQDGAKPHTAQLTTKWFADNKIRTFAKWPAHSPHLNPIERLWNIIHQRVAKLRPRTLEDLKATIQQVWDGLDFDLINNLVASFDESIKKTITRKGAPW